jgi:hypothetical protein
MMEDDAVRGEICYYHPRTGFIGRRAAGGGGLFRCCVWLMSCENQNRDNFFPFFRLPSFFSFCRS